MTHTGFLKTLQRGHDSNSGDNESTGCYTCNLIPLVGTKVIFPKERNVGISYIRMLVHDTMLNDDSYRTGTSDTPLCYCGKVIMRKQDV